MNRGQFLIILFSLLLLGNTGWTQSENRFRFEHITVDEGLAHSDAMAVIQDKNSFIWVGTNNGINRYDGYELKKYFLDHQDGLSSNRIRAMHTGNTGTVWAGTERTGLYYYDAYGDSFKNVEELTQDASMKSVLKLINKTSVRAIVSDNAGRLWVGTHGLGVFGLSFDKDNNLSRVIRVQVNGSKSSSTEVMSLAADVHGKIWIGTLDQGLWQFDAKTLEDNRGTYMATQLKSISEPDIRALFIDRNGNFWIGTGSKVYHISKAEMSKPIPVHKALEYAFQGLQCFYMDSSGRLWIGTNFGVMMMQDPKGYIADQGKHQWNKFVPVDGNRHSINSGRIHQIVEDSFNNLWLAASAGGLNKIHLRPKEFGHLYRDGAGGSALPNNYVNAIGKDEESNRLYIGTRNGLSRYDPASKTYKNFLSRLAPGNVTGTDVSFVLVTGQSVWIGTRYDGVFKMDKKGEGPPVRHPDLPGSRAWKYISIESIVKDKLGRVWLGTTDGLMLFDEQGKHLKTFTTANAKLPSNQFTFLLYDQEEDALWASTVDNGVLLLQERNGQLQLLRQFQHEPGNKNSLSVNYAWPLLKDKQGDIWIGTIGGGLHRLAHKNGQYTMQRYHAWLPENDIESILADEQGNLWIGGAGLFKFTPSTRKYLQYDVSDGLQSNSFKIGAAYRAANGMMYFGGTNGLNYFKPTAIHSNPYAPVVHITRLRVLNRQHSENSNEIGSSMVTRPFSGKDGITIKSSENDFSLEFVGLNYVNPQKQKYAYFLEGYSDDWVELPHGQRVASFANLPSGNYTFKVKVNNGEGIWSEQPAELDVVILPPWYKTWWAFLLYFGIAGALLIWYRRLTLSRLELKNKIEIETLHAEKEKELAEAKINFFTNVSHEFRTPLTLILGPMEEFMSSWTGSAEVRDKVMMMHKQTHKLLTLVNQLLSFRKIETGNSTLSVTNRNITEFVGEIFSIFKVKADEQNLDYNISAPTDALMMYIDADKLEVILTNLLSNAFKYTPEGGKIDVSIIVTGNPDQDAIWQNGMLVGNYVNLVVQDYGVGIEGADLNKIFDPYYQAQSSGNNSWKGTGIGLALVRQLVLSHHGEVSVESEIGQGTRFTVKLPFGKSHLSPGDFKEESLTVNQKVAAHTEDLVPYTPMERPVGINQLKLLIVEDNADVLSYLKGLFEMAYDVYISPDGSDAWNRVPELQPDLILSDVMMPGISGLELCKKIKTNPKTAHIPVLLLTARAAAMQELEGLETGADDYLAKPFNPLILKAKVTTILQNRTKLQEYYQRRLLLEPSEIAIPDEEKQFLENAMRIVEENIGDTDFNVQALVGMVGMSQSVFYKRIKSITGQSVIEFIKDIRLKRAAQLLASGNARISEIALLVGIEDPKNFRVSFQKVYHMSPSQYARQHRNSNNDSQRESFTEQVVE